PDDPKDSAEAREGTTPDYCGTWVSYTLGSDDNPGTKAEPVKTLKRAIDLAADGAGRVYACMDDWMEPVVVPGHVSFHGGFNCLHGWKYKDGDGHTFLMAPHDQIPVTIIDGGKGGAPYWTDADILAADALKAGGSSIGMFIRDDLHTTIRRA